MDYFAGLDISMDESPLEVARESLQPLQWTQRN
jgi:hypothetical protein